MKYVPDFVRENKGPIGIIAAALAAAVILGYARGPNGAGQTRLHAGERYPLRPEADTPDGVHHIAREGLD